MPRFPQFHARPSTSVSNPIRRASHLTSAGFSASGHISLFRSLNFASDNICGRVLYFFLFGSGVALPQAPAVEPAVQRVYIVDDEWIIAETLAAILNRNGFSAQAFHSPNRALVRALDQPPDILLTDVMMPDLSGIDLAISLRRANSNCRILLFSGQANALDLLCDARRRGYDFELLQKPLHPLQLLLRLRNARPRLNRRVANHDVPPVDSPIDPASGPISAA